MCFLLVLDLKKKNSHIPLLLVLSVCFPKFEDAVFGIKNPVMVPDHLFHPQLYWTFVHKDDVKTFMRGEIPTEFHKRVTTPKYFPHSPSPFPLEPCKDHEVNDETRAA
jgi:hypothetical protein